MVAVKVNAFGGMVPATESRLLPDNAADLSQDTWTYRGILEGFVEPSLVRAVPNGTSRSYRIPISYADATHFNDATWIDFPDMNTDIVRSPVAGDTFGRYYFACPSDIPRVNSLANIQAGNTSPFALGVIQPTTPTLAITGGGSATLESRAYVTTYVTAFAEEGPPSTPVIGNGKIDATWTVSFAAPASADITKYNLSKVRIYRTVTDSSGNAEFFMVTELAVTSTSFADTTADATVTANAQLESTTWTAPPSDLQGFVSMPNGIIAGWRNNEVWFCEPFRPHAWPAAYTLAVEYPVIGLGVLGQSLVILTQGYPMIATGLNPASMSLSTLSTLEPCMSRGSIISAPEGVYYISPNGLILISNGIAVNMTAQLILKDDWNNLMKIPTMRAARLGAAYFAFGSALQGVFDTCFDPVDFQQEDFSGGFGGIYIDPANQRVAFNLLTSGTPMTNVFNDDWSGEVVCLREGNLYRFDITNDSSPRRPLKWRSKIFQATDRKNFGALRIYFDIPPWAPAQNPVRNTDPVQTLSTDQYGLVRVYADGNLIMTRELRTSGELMKLPSGFKADFWQLEFEAYVKITNFQFATSDKELRQV